MYQWISFWGNLSLLFAFPGHHLSDRPYNYSLLSCLWPYLTNSLLILFDSSLSIDPQVTSTPYVQWHSWLTLSFSDLSKLESSLNQTEHNRLPETDGVTHSFDNVTRFSLYGHVTCFYPHHLRHFSLTWDLYKTFISVVINSYPMYTLYTFSFLRSYYDINPTYKYRGIWTLKDSVIEDIIYLFNGSLFFFFYIDSYVL